MAVVSVSLPDALMDEADRFIGRRGFAGRSDLVRAAMRDFLARQMQADGRAGERSATLTLMYPDEYERKIGEIRHDHSDVIRSMMHAHAHDLCVEVFVLEGEGRRIQAFSDALRGAKETRLVETTYTDALPERRGRGAHKHEH